jgi:hypothetical protein
MAFSEVDAMRGPKVKTAKNMPVSSVRIPHAAIEPTSPLGTVALAEFHRLIDVMELRGCLDRVDLSIITECARVKERLDIAYVADKTTIIHTLTAQRRGLLRELGLTIKPSTTLVRSDSKQGKSSSESIESRIKLRA